MREVVGSWSRAPERTVHLVTCGAHVLFASVPEEGHPIRVYLGEREQGAWNWADPWIVPWPPSVPADHDLSETSAFLAVEPRQDGLSVCVTRIEYQGGCHGLVRALWRDGWSAFQEIASPTDCDIAFGVPLVLRGEALFTIQSEDRLLRYAGSFLEIEGPEARLMGLALSDDASVLAATVEEDDAFGLARWTRVEGRYAHQSTLALPSAPTALVHGSGCFHVGFAQALPDGSVVASLPERGDVFTARLSFPEPTIARSERVSGLAIGSDVVLVHGIDDVWVQRRGETRRLVLPPRVGTRARYPQAVLVGDEAVVLVGAELGVFDLRVFDLG